MTQVDEKALPCPFCGAAPKVTHYNGTMQAQCSGTFTECAGFDVLAPVGMWNRRAYLAAAKPPAPEPAPSPGAYSTACILASMAGGKPEDYTDIIAPSLDTQGSGSEAGSNVWVLFSDGHPLFLSGSKRTAESAKKAYADDGKHTDGPFLYVLANPAPAAGDVREARNMAHLMLQWADTTIPPMCVADQEMMRAGAETILELIAALSTPAQGETR